MHSDNYQTPMPTAPERVLRRGRQLRRRRRGAQALAGLVAVGLMATGAWDGLHRNAVRVVVTSPGPSRSGPVASAFPASLYPRPVAPSGTGSVSFPGRFMCPSLAGVEAPAGGSSHAVVLALNALLNAPTRSAARTYADRAAWPLLSSGFTPDATRGAFGPADVAVAPAGSSSYAAAYKKLCGPRLINDSRVATWCTSSTTGAPLAVPTCLSEQPAMTSYSFFFERHGHWLMWGMQGGE